MNERVVLIHGHIFKNAGSTLDWSLEQQYGSGFHDDREDEAMRADPDAYLCQVLDEQPSLRALSSHHLTSTAEPPANTYFLRWFLLRDPIERILSVYKFERKQDGNSPGAINAKKLTPRQYIEWRMTDDVGATIRNFQTRYLGGMITSSRRPVDDEVFEMACQTMKTSFIGIVERYDESMVMFELGSKMFEIDIDLSYVRQNSNPEHASATHAQKIEELRDLIGDDLLDEVTRRNLYDAALYNLASARMNTYIDGRDSFADHLADFEKRVASRAEQGGSTDSKLRGLAKSILRS